MTITCLHTNKFDEADAFISLESFQNLLDTLPKAFDDEDFETFVTSWEMIVQLGHDKVAMLQLVENVILLLLVNDEEGSPYLSFHGLL
jgi:hypothetical protein